MLEKDKEMKILHINCNYMSTALHQVMIEHLNQLTDNDVFCPISEKTDIIVKSNDNVKAIKCFKKYDRYVFFYKQKKIIRTLLDNYKINEYDIIHAYTLFTDGNVAYEIHKKYNIPYVVAIRSTDFEFFKYRPYLRKRGIKILRNASKIFFLSAVTKNKFFTQYISLNDQKELNKKIEIIPNGIDDFWFQNINNANKKRNGNELKVICVAQLIKRKNILLLQEAINQMSNIHLIVVGQNKNSKIYNKIISSNNTTYYKSMKKEELINLYRKADIFALVSVGETFGLVYAEALTQRIPIIYTKGEGFDGQIKDDYVGISVKPKIEDIISAINKIADNYKEYSENTIKVIDRFRWNNIVKQYNNIYFEIKEMNMNEKL